MEVCALELHESNHLFLILTAVLTGLRRAQRDEIFHVVLGESLQYGSSYQSALAVADQVDTLRIRGAYRHNVATQLLDLSPHWLQAAPASVSHGIVNLRSWMHL